MDSSYFIARQIKSIIVKTVWYWSEDRPKECPETDLQVYGNFCLIEQAFKISEKQMMWSLKGAGTNDYPYIPYILSLQN